jgi:hypothetical protein
MATQSPLGQAPRLGPDCRVRGMFNDKLEFTLLRSGTTTPSNPPAAPSLGPPADQVSVRMEQQGGVYVVPVRFNDMITLSIATFFAIIGLPTPAPVHLGDAAAIQAFPINNPSWSLFFELLASLIFGLIASLLSITMLTLVVAVSCVWLTYVAFQSDGIAHVGFYYQTLIAGVPRTALSFFAGVLIHTLHKTGRLPKIRVHPLLISAALVAIFVPDYNAILPNSWYDMLCVGIISVLPVVRNAPASCTQRPDCRSCYCASTEREREEFAFAHANLFIEASCPDA